MSKLFPTIDSVHTVVLDFDGVFTDNKVWVDRDGRESVRCDRADGLAFDMVRAFQKQGKLNVEFLVLSKEPNSVVQTRAQKLKLDCRHGIGNKLAFIRENLAGRFPTETDMFSGLICLGNDLNDIPLMRCAGYSVAPADAHPKVKEIAHLILDQKGGEGFVRAFIERLLGINELPKEELDELISHC